MTEFISTYAFPNTHLNFFLFNINTTICKIINEHIKVKILFPNNTILLSNNDTILLGINKII